jgi:hypothetical protein
VSQDPIETLIAQFARFAVDTDLGPDDWEMAATEFGVSEIMKATNRFRDSWKFNDNDKHANTIEFLREVSEEDEEKVVGVMQRIYTLADTGSDTVEKYPALEPLENKDPITGNIHTTFRSEQFLNINDIPGTFYPDLVENINQCYSAGVNDATLVLTRKLLENLIIDILREEYGKQEIDLYFRPENKRFENFSTLLNNFKDRLDDFQHLSGGLNNDFIDELDSFRQDANVEAHSIEINITESEIEEYRKQAQHASKLLFRIKNNI